LKELADPKKDRLGEGSGSDQRAAQKKTTLIKLEVTHKLPSEAKSLISSRYIELKKILNLVKMAMPFLPPSEDSKCSPWLVNGLDFLTRPFISLNFALHCG